MIHNEVWALRQTGKPLPRKGQMLGRPLVSFLQSWTPADSTAFSWKKCVNRKFHINQFIALTRKQQKTLLGYKDLENFAAKQLLLEKKENRWYYSSDKSLNQSRKASDEHWDYFKDIRLTQLNATQIISVKNWLRTYYMQELSESRGHERQGCSLDRWAQDSVPKEQHLTAMREQGFEKSQRRVFGKFQVPEASESLSCSRNSGEEAKKEGELSSGSTEHWAI